MTASDVLALLAAERGVSGSGRIGLTRLRQLARRIGRDAALAQALWAQEEDEARIVALLVDDPARMTREQAERQVQALGDGLLAHVFASCDAPLAKTPFVVALLDDWVRSADPVRRDCGYGLLYEVSKFSGRKAPDDAYFLAHIATIASRIDGEPERVRLAMGAALMGMGKRSAGLNAAALQVARRIGPIAFQSASGDCAPFDVAKHLSAEPLRRKLGL